MQSTITNKRSWHTSIKFGNIKFTTTSHDKHTGRFLITQLSRGSSQEVCRQRQSDLHDKSWHFKRYSHKMIKHTHTIRRLQLTSIPSEIIRKRKMGIFHSFSLTWNLTLIQLEKAPARSETKTNKQRQYMLVVLTNKAYFCEFRKITRWNPLKQHAILKFLASKKAK